MRVVSYTRAISYRLKDENPSNIIGLQNEHIQQYIKEKGWKLAAKYSDRKFSSEEMTAFNQMLEAGLAREFDCVVMDSIFRFGHNLTDAVSVLRETFYPIGIHFVVVQDDFSSFGKSVSAITDYFKQKRMAILGNASWTRWRALEKEGIMVKSHLSYGYLLSEDRRSMIIDESVAPIIRNIFQWFLSGMNYQTIADRLNAEGVISPQEHMTKVYGREPNFIVDSIWRGSSIHKLLEKPIYMGKVVRKIGGVDTVIEVPPIVSEEEFLKTQELIPKKPARAITWKIAGVNILNKRIYDKKTGKALMCMKSPIDPNDRVYTLKKNIRYLSKEEQKKSIPYGVVMGAVKEALRNEAALVDQIDEILQTEQSQDYLEQQLQDYRKSALKLVEQLNTVYEERMNLHRMYEDGRINAEELEQKEDTCQVKLMRIEQQFALIMAQVEDQKTAFSRINPWLALYRQIEVPDELERSHIMQWVDRVAVVDAQTIEVGLKQQEWKYKLPQEWLTLRRDG